MAGVDDTFWDEIVLRVQSAEDHVARLSERLRVLEDRCALAHGLRYCARCESYRGAGPCDDELCAVHTGSD